MGAGASVEKKMKIPKGYKFVNSLKSEEVFETLELEDVKTKIHIVLKRLKKSKLTKDQIDKYVETLNKVNELNISNIIKYDSIEENEDYLNLIMKKYPYSLSSFENPVEHFKDDKELYRIILEICKGFKDLRSIDLCHGNINPSNVFIDEDGSVKLSDFCVNILCSNGMKTLSERQKAYYISSDEKITSDCDIFSLGRIIYYLKSGKEEYTGNLECENGDIWNYLYNKTTCIEMEERYKVDELIVCLNKLINGEKVLIPTKAQECIDEDIKDYKKEKRNELDIQTSRDLPYLCSKLYELKHLKSLVFKRCKFTNGVVFTDNITKIKFQEYNFSEDSEDNKIEYICKSLPTAKNLEELDISANQLTNVKELTESLKTIQKLKSLNISNNPLGKEGIIHLTESFNDLSHLEVLNISCCKIENDGLSSVSRFFSSIAKLKTINIASNCITDIKEFSEHLKFLTNLRNLCLSANKIEDMNNFSEVLKTLTKLESLELNDIGLLEPKVLINSVKYLISLERLDISSNYIGSEAGQLLGENLYNLSNLTHLNIKCNDLEELGSISISKCFSSMSKLKYLDISTNQIVKIKEFAENLKYLPELSNLNMSFNKIESEGIKELSDSFKSLTNLTELDISSNPLNEESSLCLCMGIKNLEKLTEINLRNTNVIDSALQQLSNSFSILTSLKRVVLRDNQISDEGVKILIENLSNIKGMYIQLGNNEKIKEIDKLDKMIKNMNLMCFVFF